jgi:LysR family transcriptional regulator, low CO2-responsive transcriptional regulator
MLGCNTWRMSITLTQLNTLLAVIQGGSVTAAADELVVTQPSVSSALAALARELDCELFVRAGRGIRLTEAGAAFAPYAADVIGLLDQGRQAAREAAATVERKLQIIAVTTAAESFVPPLMQAFAEERPEIKLTLAVGNQREVLERVINHSVDVAIAGRPDSDDRLVAEPLSDNEIACITAPDDPSIGDGPIESVRLAGRAWLLRERGSGTRRLNEQFLADRGLDPTTLTLGSNGAIKQAARAGLGVSLLSRVAVEPELASGWLGELTLTDGPPSRPWFLLRSAVGPVRPPVQLFAAFVRRQAVEPDRRDPLRRVQHARQ